MKLKIMSYWVTTAIIASETLAGGLTDLIHGREILIAGDPVVQVVMHLGYPVYLLTILGIWKVLGGVVLLIPRFPRLKEWAYAGIFFELAGAAASLALHDGAIISSALILALFALASWALRPPERTLGVLFPAKQRREASTQPVKAEA